jgi:hypothetical protein
MASLDNWGVVAGIVGAAVAIIGLLVTLVDRWLKARSAQDTATSLVQNFYVTGAKGSCLQ